MASDTTTLHLLCGKIASGKSTLAAQLGDQPKTVIIAEDSWLAALYDDQMSSVADYVRCSKKLRTIIGPHIVSLLRAGVSVVMDFQANTVAARKWMREIIDFAQVAHQLHYLNVPENMCKARLHKRNRSGNHAFTVSDEQFRLVSDHFVAPKKDEGFNIIFHLPSNEK